LTAIRLDQLTKTFGNATALDAVCLEVEAGTLTVLLGPSGCGKSTCLRLIAGLEQADSGLISIAGKNVSKSDPAERGIAMVFQSYALFPHLTVAENIIFGLRVRHMAASERNKKLHDVAELVGLSDYLERRPSQLSGGQRQRVALARAIVSEKPVCLMDEPLSNLDAQLRHEMRIEIRALQQRLGMTMIYVTHDQTEAMTMADRIVLMREGRIEQTGKPSDLYGNPASIFVARFIGAPPMNVIASPIVGQRLGVRPEHVRLEVLQDASTYHHQAHSIAGVVETVEYLGADSVVTLRAGEYQIAARLPGLPSFVSGQAVSAHWSASHEFTFDAANGRRISAPRSTPETKESQP
jgi:sn-glycerol 3-phosphate transport system ATP-binding protein